MRLLLDTNVFLEILLRQENAGAAMSLLEKGEEHELFLTDYALHSVGVVLFRRKLHGVFADFVKDVLLGAGLRVVALGPEDLHRVSEVAGRFGLDFDDAYQYAAARRDGLTLVSFDSDFDRTDLARKVPGEIVATE